MQYMNRRRIFMAAIAVFFLIGCAHLPSAGPSRYGPRKLPHEKLTIRQLMAFRSGGYAFTGRGILKLDGGRLDIVALSSFGAKLFHFRLENGKISTVFLLDDLKFLKPEMIIRDICLIYFLDPFQGDYGRGRYRAWGFTLRDTRDGEGFLRKRVVRRYVRVMEITYQDYRPDSPLPHRILLHNDQADYTLKIINE